MPTVNCAFGPKSSFLLWIDEGPGRDHKPKYTRSETIVSKHETELKWRQFCKITRCSSWGTQWMATTYQENTFSRSCSWEWRLCSQHRNNCTKPTHKYVVAPWDQASCRLNQENSIWPFLGIWSSQREPERSRKGRSWKSNSKHWTRWWLLPYV